MALEKTLDSSLDCKETQRVTSPPSRKSVLSVHWKDWCWSWNSNTLATSCKKLTHWKRPWCWERLKAGEGDDRGWDGWMASLTQWTWVWWTPGVGDGQGGLACCSPWGHKESDTTERLNWTELKVPPPTGESIHVLSPFSEATTVIRWSVLGLFHSFATAHTYLRKHAHGNLVQRCSEQQQQKWKQPKVNN